VADRERHLRKQTFSEILAASARIRERVAYYTSGEGMQGFLRDLRDREAMSDARSHPVPGRYDWGSVATRLAVSSASAIGGVPFLDFDGPAPSAAAVQAARARQWRRDSDEVLSIGSAHSRREHFDHLLREALETLAEAEGVPLLEPMIEAIVPAAAESIRPFSDVMGLEAGVDVGHLPPSVLSAALDSGVALSDEARGALATYVDSFVIGLDAFFRHLDAETAQETLADVVTELNVAIAGGQETSNDAAALLASSRDLRASMGGQAL
jgi:hypothetical protein